MEDFGYTKDDNSNNGFSIKIKKAFLIGATLFSIACFIYITISAYHFVYQDQNGDIETIKSPEEPIKVAEDDQNANSDSMKINRAIYEDIFGNKKELTRPSPKIQEALAPALPPKSLEENRKIYREGSANISTSETKTNTAKTEGKKIIVYSEDKKEETPKKDLLTGKSSQDSRPAPQIKAESKKRYVRVQVAAMTSRSSAEEHWNKMGHLHPNLFSGLKRFIEEVDLGKRGIFYRLQIGNFFNQVDAEEFCEKYVSQTQKSRADCIIVE